MEQNDNKNVVYVVREESSKAPQPQKKTNGVGIASLVCGIVGFMINPLYLVSVGAVVCGIVGIATGKDKPKGTAIAGLILGLVAWGLQFICDFVLSIFTLGLSFFI